MKRDKIPEPQFVLDLKELASRATDLTERYAELYDENIRLKKEVEELSKTPKQRKLELDAKNAVLRARNQLLRGALRGLVNAHDPKECLSNDHVARLRTAQMALNTDTGLDQE